ncbi:MAG: hypothetical protein A2V86_11645 [Deltaproteobacteria bacterium RBG_16_49_23]|nr:MAG: hypothetical protein A2V86_11645 [Deltaproteobacteria bacterium RBG_16_49_23]
MKRTGVKYCGGCNPTYERVEMFQRIQSRLKDQLLFFRYDEPDIDLMVLLSGCHRACAAHDLNRAVPHYSVTGENDVESLLERLTSPTVKGDL